MQKNRKSRILSFLLSVVMAMTCCTSFAMADGEESSSVPTVPTNGKLYNFSATEIDGAINLNSSVPVYSSETGYGFVSENSAMPSRKLGVDSITMESTGAKIVEDGSGTYLNSIAANYNYGGLVFRTDLAETGAYKMIVRLDNCTSSDVTVAPNGMQASELTSNSAWDSSGLVPKQNYATWTDDKTWEFTFVAGQKFLEIEVEPKAMPTSSKPVTVGISSISIEKVANKTKAAGEKPTVFVLGDSTEKTYTFEEASMSGWGQIINKMFDLDKVNVINYSMGGRSMRACYTENRFNDLLLTAKEGDFLLLHSAHNDETKDSTSRFGRGSTNELYPKWLNDIYIPAMLSRGVHPILVTSMPRTGDGKYSENDSKPNGFNPDSPGFMRDAAKANDKVECVELYANAKKYIDTMGPDRILNIYMSIEAGETPGKTNSGSYANGHPGNKTDGTHYKEAASKVWCQLIAQDIYKQANESSASDTIKELSSYLKDTVKEASASDDWSKVFPERANDVSEKDSTGYYYRNQIEKLIQLGVMEKDASGNFYAEKAMTPEEFISALCSLWGLDLTDEAVKAEFANYQTSNSSTSVGLTREVMASIILKAYALRFGFDKDGNYNKPDYMTKYNGSTISPDDPEYDPNLTGAAAQYYPLVGWGNLTDKDDISLEYADDMYKVYTLGLMRSEKDIARGKMKNGTEIEPKVTVTRAKAAKELWFLWVLGQNNVKAENQILTITKDGSTYNDVAKPDKTSIMSDKTVLFSNVDINRTTGLLSVSVDGTVATGDKLNVKVYSQDDSIVTEKNFDITATGKVSAVDTTIEKGQYAVLSVTNAGGEEVSMTRKVVRNELYIPVRSYKVQNVSGIKNGTIGLKNLSEETDTASLADFDEDMKVSLASEDGAIWWKASVDVQKDVPVSNQMNLVPTIDMSYTSAKHTTSGEDFTGYVAASINGFADATKDRSGFLFRPDSDGILTAYVHKLGANKNFIIAENGKAETEALVSSKDKGLSGQCSLSTPVSAGVTYYISVLGSRGRFAGVSFVSGAPVVSTLAKPGETVQITATPNEGYYVKEVTATDEKGNTITLNSDSSKVTSTFEMPESNVTISAVFAKGSGDNTAESTSEESSESTTETIILGDANGDGKVEFNDASLVLQYVLNKANVTADFKEKAADVDKNKNIDARDVASILQFVLNNGNFIFKK